eukprot:1155665-Pelagomonas_calceolata.AAC.3
MGVTWVTVASMEVQEGSVFPAYWYSMYCLPSLYARVTDGLIKRLSSLAYTKPRKSHRGKSKENEDAKNSLGGHSNNTGVHCAGGLISLSTSKTHFTAKWQRKNKRTFIEQRIKNKMQLFHASNWSNHHNSIICVDFP